MMGKFIETHCHLDYLKNLPLEELRELYLKQGVERVITIGVDPQNLDTVFDLSAKYDEIFFTQGIHPHDAKEATESDFEKIISRTKAPKMVAIGEIGLDYHYNHSPREIQIKQFERQLQIASDHDLPVVIHTREAEEDTTMILKNFSSLLRKKGVVHSFTSSQKLADFVLQENFYLGFNGIVTFKNATNVQEVVKQTPPERILFETDAPFLTPVPHRGQENAPHYLPLVAKKIADLKGMNHEELMEIVYKNSLQCFWS